MRNYKFKIYFKTGNMMEVYASTLYWAVLEAKVIQHKSAKDSDIDYVETDDGSIYNNIQLSLFKYRES